MQSTSRRDFMKQVALALGAGVVVPAVFSTVALAEDRRPARPGAGGDASLPLIQEGVGMAASLGYVTDKAHIKDAKVKVARQGVDFKDQRCQVCNFYTKVGAKDGSEAGKCQLITGGLVKSQGWCNSWAKKA